MTITGMVTVTLKAIVAGLLVWLIISGVLIVSYLGLMKTLGVL
jgi:hypothetical protein